MPRDKAIKTPEDLQSLFEQYSQWVKKNPYLVHDFVGKDAEEVRRERQRPVTWIGFEAWLYREGIVTHLGHYEQNKDGSYSEYLPIIRACKKQCSMDIIEGALAGVYNQNIAARLEGLIEKQQTETEGKLEVTVKYAKRDNNTSGTSSESGQGNS